MFQKLESVEKRYEELTEKISNPEIIAKQTQWREYMKEHAEIEPIVQKYREYKKAKQAMEEAKEMLSDPDLKELAEIEMLENKEKIPALEEEIKILLIPKELGGYKEISFMITGKGAYSRLKFESGVHRVQRVPDTEASGRIHTSTSTVAVLPVVEDVEIDINPSDIKMEVFRASGAGGQHVNKTSSAVRLTHIPTGIVAECQTERSQLQNKDNAMKMLRTKLYEIEKQKQDSEITNARRSQVGSGDRSEKIRTYNYPQGRITDHRIGFSIYQMEDFLNGNLDEMIDNLTAADRAEKLKGNEEE